MTRISHRTKNFGAHLWHPRSHCSCLLFLEASTILILFTPLLIGAFFIDHNQSPRQEEWSYSKQLEWHHYFPYCGQQSKLQSPINIKRESVITNNQLTLKFYNYNRRTRFTIQNAHHTIKMNPIPLNSRHLPGNDMGGNSQTFDINTVDEADGPMSGGLSGPQSPPLPVGSANLVGPGGNRIPLSSFHNQQQPVGQNNLDHGPKLDMNNNNNLDQRQHQQHERSPDHQIDRHQEQRRKEDVMLATFARRQKPLGHQFPYSSSDDHLESATNFVGQRQQQQIQHQHQQPDNDEDDRHKQQALPYDGVPVIKLDWMDDHNNEYRLHDIHFHWGTKEDNGSEHSIDGRKSAMEMHLVHIKKGLKKDQIGYNSDSVVVIAVLIESYRKNNANFNPIVNTLTSINASDISHVIEYSSINDLLPNDRSRFYTYSGSLTTPPCYEVVNWIVMHERVYINAKQMEMFRNIYARVEHANYFQNGNEKFNFDEQQLPTEPAGPLYKIMPNIRNRQQPRGRPIMASFSLNNIERDVDNDLVSGADRPHANLYSLMTISLATIISLLHYSSTNYNNIY